MKLTEFSKILTIIILIISITTNSLSISKKSKSKKRTKTNTKRSKIENSITGSSLKIRKLENSTDQSLFDKNFDNAKFFSTANKELTEGIDFGAFFINLKKIEEGKDHYKFGIPIEFKIEPSVDSLIRKLCVNVSKYTFYFPFRNIIYVTKDPMDPFSILIEINADYFDDKYYVIKLALPKDKNNPTDFIVSRIRNRGINIRHFLLEKKKLLLDSIKQKLQSSNKQVKDNAQNQINTIENTTKEFFLPLKNMFVELNNEILKKNFNSVYQRLNRLNPVGFNKLISDVLI